MRENLNFSGFLNPPVEKRTIPKWFWNIPAAEMTRERMTRIIRDMRDKDLYGGVMPVPYSCLDEYLSEEYLEKYKMCLDICAGLGMHAALWDEGGFPSGRANGRLEAAYPEHTAKYLAKEEWVAEGPGELHREFAGGTVFSVVAIDAANRITDLTSDVSGQTLETVLPVGSYRLMAFLLRTAPEVKINLGKGRFVDFLDREAVEAYISVNQQKYYDAMPEHFGSTILYEFYDETSFWYIGEGRIWTPKFGERFEQKYGISPNRLYPALWYDIGEQTESARTMMFGLRAELYAENYVGTLARWDEAHGIRLTGHQDQEEMISPVPLSGDLMKVFRYQHIPGIDVCQFRNRVARAYRIVSSAARNWDRPLVMSECFGGNQEDVFPPDYITRETMDMYAGGINLLMEYGVWMDTAPGKVKKTPELSWHNPRYAEFLPGYHLYNSRLAYLMQGGQHKTDLGILYPIHTLQAWYRFDDQVQYIGGATDPDADYMEVIELLTQRLCRDFTLLHPEALDERCVVEKDRLKLQNEHTPEEYRVLMVTGCRVISLDNLRKVQSFYDQGGKVIFTGRLPAKGIRPEEDDEVCHIIREMTGVEPGRTEFPYTVTENGKGGKTVCLGTLTKKHLEQALGEVQTVWDVEITPWRYKEDRFRSSPYDWTNRLPNGDLTYTCKQQEGRKLLFLANSSDIFLFCDVTLRGIWNPELWDPHTGERRPVRYTHETRGAETVTRVELVINKVHSLFLISEEEKSTL